MAFFRDFYFKTQTYILASSFWIICTRRLHIHKEVNFFFSPELGVLLYIYTHTQEIPVRECQSLAAIHLKLFCFIYLAFLTFFLCLKEKKPHLFLSLSLFPFAGLMFVDHETWSIVPCTRSCSQTPDRKKKRYRQSRQSIAKKKKLCDALSLATVIREIPMMNHQLLEIQTLI